MQIPLNKRKSYITLKTIILKYYPEEIQQFQGDAKKHENLNLFIQQYRKKMSIIKLTSLTKKIANKFKNVFINIGSNLVDDI